MNLSKSREAFAVRQALEMWQAFQLKKRWGPALAVLTAATLLVGCGSTGKVAQTVEIVAGPLVFQPKSLTIKQGETSRIVLKNTDTQTHDLTVVKFKGKSSAVSDSGGHTGGHEPAMNTHMSAGANKSASIDITPSATGTYEVYCTLPGHKDSGMTATLIVQ